MVDDIIMIIDCTDTEVERIEHLFQTTDPSKPVTFKHSTQSADYLDVTVFKGPQFTLSLLANSTASSTPNPLRRPYTSRDSHTTQTPLSSPS